jgi:hypothetical protein
MVFGGPRRLEFLRTGGMPEDPSNRLRAIAMRGNSGEQSILRVPPSVRRRGGGRMLVCPGRSGPTDRWPDRGGSF